MYCLLLKCSEIKNITLKKLRLLIAHSAYRRPFFMETKTMDKILLKQEEIKLLMTELEGMEQGTPEFGDKMALVSTAQAELKMIEEQATAFTAMQASLSSFSPSKAVESPEMGSRSIVKSGFAADPKKGFKNSGEMLSLMATQTVGAKNSFALLPNADHRLHHLLDIGMTAGQHNTTNDGLCIPAELDPTRMDGLRRAGQ